MSDLRSMKATISADLLRIMVQSDIQWVLLFRKNSDLSEAQAYAWSNTLVFEYYDGIFLLATTKGEYATDQLERYSSGLWSYRTLDSLDDLDDAAMAVADLYEVT